MSATLKEHILKMGVIHALDVSFVLGDRLGEERDTSKPTSSDVQAIIHGYNFQMSQQEIAMTCQSSHSHHKHLAGFI